MSRDSLRKLCLMLAMLMVISTVPAVHAYTGVHDWAQADISVMEDMGLIPETLMDTNLQESISRLDMSRIAVLAFEKLTGDVIELPQEHPFTDTQETAAEKAYAAGIIQGNGNGTFRPEDDLTRLEFFVIVAQFLNAVGVSVRQEDYADLSGFSDAAELPVWGRSYASLTVGLGIVNGTGSALNWQADTSAQEALVLFCRTYRTATEALSAGRAPFPNLAGWAEAQVLEMDEMGLIPESVKYSPMNEAITRQDLCKVLMATYKYITGITDEELGTPEDPFDDTDDVDVCNAYRLGIVSGRGSGRFSPDDPIIRQDFFKMTVNFLNAIGFPYTDDETVELEQFQDAENISEYALGASRLLVGLGIVNGSTDKCLNPRSNIASQEALVIFYRVFCFVTGWGSEEPPVEENPTEPTEPPVEENPTEPTEPPVEEDPTKPTEPPVEEDPTKPTEPPVEENPTEPTEPPVEENPDQIPELCLEVVDFAMGLLGCDYTYGGKNPETGFDCSGFVYYVYKQFGYTLNPGATNQWKHLSDEIIPEDELRPGDLVFFSENGAVSGMSHVGMYIGDGQFIHAENPRNGVTVTDMDQSYYAARYLGAKRVIN